MNRLRLGLLLAALIAIVLLIAPLGRGDVASTQLAVADTVRPATPVQTEPDWNVPALDQYIADLNSFYAEVSRQIAEQAEQARARAATPTTRSETPVSGTAESGVSVKPRGTGSGTAAIAAHFGDLYDSAYGVADCESGLDPGQISPGGGNWGLFQINTVHRPDFVQFVNAILDDQQAAPDDPRRSWEGGVLNADLNAAYARKLFNGEGWGPWACRWAA